MRIYYNDISNEFVIFQNELNAITNTYDIHFI